MGEKPKRPTFDELLALNPQPKSASPPPKKPTKAVEKLRKTSGKAEEKDQSGLAHPSPLPLSSSQKKWDSPPKSGIAHQGGIAGASPPKPASPPEWDSPPSSKYRKYEKHSRNKDKEQLNIRIDKDLKDIIVEAAANAGMELSQWVSRVLRESAGGIAHQEWDSPIDLRRRLDWTRTRDEYVSATGKRWTPADSVSYAQIAALPEPIRRAGLYKSLLLGDSKMRTFAYVVTAAQGIKRECDAGLHEDIESYAQSLEKLWKEKPPPEGS